MIQVTIACPVALIADAGQLARVIGYGEADGETFDIAPRVEIDGEIYAVASGIVAPAFVTDAVAPLIQPAWGADMEAAARAQALIDIWQPGVTLLPDRILAVVSLDPPEARQILEGHAPLDAGFFIEGEP